MSIAAGRLDMPMNFILCLNDSFDGRGGLVCASSAIVQFISGRSHFPAGPRERSHGEELHMAVKTIRHDCSNGGLSGESPQLDHKLSSSQRKVASAYGPDARLSLPSLIGGKEADFDPGGLSLFGSSDNARWGFNIHPRWSLPAREMMAFPIRAHLRPPRSCGSGCMARSW